MVLIQLAISYIWIVEENYDAKHPIVDEKKVHCGVDNGEWMDEGNRKSKVFPISNWKIEAEC